MNFVSFNDFQSKAKGLPYNKTLKINANYATQTQFVRTQMLRQLQKAKNQNGLIEKITDKIKNVLNFGSSSKNIENKINQNKPDEEINSEIKSYRRSQENSAQTVADIASAGASIFAFSAIKQNLQLLIAKYYHMGSLNSAKKLTDFLPDKKYIVDNAEKLIKNNKTPAVAAALGAMIAGGFIKSLLLKINRIGTKQYKPEITKDMSKKEIKEAKKKARKERKNANFRNRVSGAINGALTPLILLGGAVGAPLYVLGNSLNRYFIASREDRGNKSFKSYIENIKNSPVSSALGLAAISIPAFIKGKFNKVFDKNLNTVVEQLRKSNLQKTSTVKSSYQQLEEILFSKSEVSDIFKGKINGISPDNFSVLNEKDKIKLQIQALGEENIFAVKFKQISDSSDAISDALKEKCPPTYTLQEASEKINNAFNGEYKIISSYGAGTVAETYLVEDKSGKQFCIKMLKKGIDAKKIERDEQAVIDYIQNLENKTQDEKDFLIKNFRNIAQSVKEEVDLSNEMKSAQELAKVTKNARIVKPVKLSADNSLYVMEKADGVSLQSLMEYVSEHKSVKTWKEFYEKSYKEAVEKNDKWEIDYYKKALEQENEKLEKLNKINEDIGNLTKDEAKILLERYQDVLVEQFNQIGKDGKIIHGDIHPGNIYIDIKALRAGRKDFFTLIDTGNTINQTSKQALRFMNLSKYIQNADTENIADFVLEGAKLPEGMTNEQAREALIKGLNKTFFDYETYTGPVSNSTILGITDGIMQSLNIIPGGVQAGLIKSKTSADRSMQKFQESFFNGVLENLSNKMEALGIEEEKDILKPGNMAKMAKESLSSGLEIKNTLQRYNKKQSMQEKVNLAMLPPNEKIKMKKSPNAPKKNSKEYLTYAIKQHKKLPTVTDILGDLNNMSTKDFIKKLQSVEQKDIELIDQTNQKETLLALKQAIDEAIKQGIDIEKDENMLYNINGVMNLLKSPFFDI